MSLRTEGTRFITPEGKTWKYRGVTAFSSFQDFLAGKDLSHYANWTRSVGGNTWRTFLTWVVTDFNPLRLGREALTRELESYAKYVKTEGLFMHNVTWCDQVNGSSVLLSQSDRDFLLDLNVHVSQGNFVEVMNEAWQNGGNDMCGAPFTDRFKGCFAVRSTPQDGQDPRICGSLLNFTNDHTPRDDEWPRKAKNLLETSVQGIGSIPATHLPAIGGEPMGIFEEEIPGKRTASPSDCADYFAVAELFSAGACLHGDGSTLQRCTVPGPVAQQCAEAAIESRKHIPADAQLGEYTRGGLDTCPIEHSDSLALRTFGMIQGNKSTVVVVRPQPNWKLTPVHGWRVDSVNGHVIALSR